MALRPFSAWSYCFSGPLGLLRALVYKKMGIQLCGCGAAPLEALVHSFYDPSKILLAAKHGVTKSGAMNAYRPTET